ncbi:MAG TPA: hypothetical protein VE197_07095 [Mycobacterium sp.]|nr:hypothetical protein [Mycobacterium sp.]
MGRIQNTVSDKRLAIMSVGKAPQYLTPATLAYLSPACSPDGFAVAAVQYPNGGKVSGPATLTTVTVKNGNTSQPAPNPGLLDSSPQWAEAGILYGRTPPGSGTVQLWYARRDRMTRIHGSPRRLPSSPGAASEPGGAAPGSWIYGLPTGS